MTQETKRRTLARDTRDGNIGEVMDANYDNTVLYLRPVGGGIEWEAPREHVEIIEHAETAA